jgi:DNA-binding NarL/FixJ family response regulator
VDPLRIVIVDDHPVFAEALRERLSAETDLDVVATAADGRAARSAVATLQPDVVTLDIQLGEEDGLAVGTELLDIAPRLALVAVTCVDDPLRAVEGVRAGVRAWVPKDTGMEFLLAAIRGAPQGHSWFPPAVLGRMLPLLAQTSPVHRSDERLAALTGRERQILECMVDGLDRQAIAEELRLSANTVRTHVQSVLSKLKVHSSLEAVALARAAGLPDERVERRAAGGGGG